MNYNLFMEKAKLQDPRNVFGSIHTLDIETPKQMHQFYQTCNPIDVEIHTNDYEAIYFIPYTELIMVQKDYSFLCDCFVFATCEGDPIYLKANHVYTSLHDDIKERCELLASNIDEYLMQLINKMDF